MSVEQGATPADLAGARLSAATSVVGVIGDPVAHSLSPALHNAAFAQLGLDWISVAFRVPAGRVETALAGARTLGVRGLSVTMPHKEAAAAAAERRSHLVEELGAANCVVPSEEGWTAENTDGAGFVASLRRGSTFEPDGCSCLVVGAGGAARAVVRALAEAGAREVVVANRSAERAERAAALAGAAGRLGAREEASACDLVVNATPLGMGGTDEAAAMPVDPALLGPGQLAVDLVYHPEETPWLAAVRDRGAAVASGLGMLVHQAALQLALWTGIEAPVEAMWQEAARGTDSGVAG